MALALIKFVDQASGKTIFEIDIGDNRYFKIAVGNKEIRRSHGVKLLAEPSYISDLSSIPEVKLGRTVVEVDDSHFDREFHFIQLQSFRDEQLNGPAVSEILRLPRGVPANIDLDIVFGLSSGDENMQAQNQRVIVKPFNYSEPGQYSQSLFLSALAGMLPTIMPAVASILPSLLPAVAPIVNSVIGGLTSMGGNQAAAPAAQAPAQTAAPAQNRSNTGSGVAAVQDLVSVIGERQTAQNLAELLQQVTALIESQNRTSTAASYYTAQPLQTRSASLQARVAAPVYSEAKVAWAALLPMLQPILQQVLTPETVQSVVNMPNEHMQTVINGLKDFGRLSIESTEQHLKHLREIHPEIDDPALDQLLMSMSRNINQPLEVDYKRVSSVHLSHKTGRAISINGQSKNIFKAGSQLKFPLNVSTPQTINNAIVKIVVRDRNDLSPLLTKKINLESVTDGDISIMPELSAQETSQLSPGQDYFLNIHLIWKNRDNKKRGTSIQTIFCLTNEFVFNHVENTQQVFELRDFNTYREYWHKIWQGRFTRNTSKYQLEMKYHYLLNPSQAENSRLETQTRLSEEGYTQNGRLRSGMELSIQNLIQLKSRLLPGTAALSENEISALNHPDFIKRFNSAATLRSKLRGKNQETVQIWVYPVIKIQKAVLKKINEINEYGQVVSMLDHSVEIPMPTQMKYIGVKS